MTAGAESEAAQPGCEQSDEVEHREEQSEEDARKGLHCGDEQHIADENRPPDELDELPPEEGVVILPVEEDDCPREGRLLASEDDARRLQKQTTNA